VAPGAQGFRNEGEGLNLSVVIPCYNEEESLRELVRKLDAVVDRDGHQAEYVFIDDGSTDKSLLVLRELHRENPRVKVLSFRRNQGKSDALAAGFEVVRGDVVFTMDADLQDDPEEIPRFLARIEQGADMVSGWKKQRQDPVSKRLPSKLFNSVTALLSGIKIHDFNCGFKAYTREVVESIDVYGELHRYIPVLAGWAGFRVEELPVRHFRRKYGSSKFGPARFLNGLFDLVTVMFITRRSAAPLHFFGRVAFFFFAVGFAICLYFLVLWLLGHGLRIRPIMLAGFVSIIVAIQVASIGLLAELLSARLSRHRVISYREKLLD
jgi:glycosyltransferase involved in cell wall biosynthesis